jgi:Protein of unknown function (DUF1761)
MIPVLHISPIAVIAAAIVSLFWGWCWHNFICGKKYASMCGMHPNMNKREMRIATLVSFIAALLTAYALYRLILVAQVANLMPGRSIYQHGFCVAFLVWIGFYIPMFLHATVWMEKSWKFFVVKSVNQFINLLIMTMIIAYWAKMNTV